MTHTWVSLAQTVLANGNTKEQYVIIRELTKHIGTDHLMAVREDANLTLCVVGD